MMLVEVGTIQSPVAGWRFPSSISSAFLNTFQLFLVKTTWHPLSHSCLMDMRDEWARPGTICASVAASPSPGKFKLPVWVDYITSLSGKVMFNGTSAGLLLHIGTLGSKKWAVAPESAIASVVPRVMLAQFVGVGMEVLSQSEIGLVDAVASSDWCLAEEQLLVTTVLSSSSPSSGYRLLLLFLGIG